MIKSLKTLLGLSLLGFFGVWTGCSSDSAPVAPYSASKAQDTSPASTEAVFTDDNLLRAVREAVFPAGTPATTTLTLDDLSGLKVLKASDKGITNLSGLENATNLDTLILSSNGITDLTPLAGLTNLEYLDLQKQYNESIPTGSSRAITDVTPLAGLTNLKRLHLYKNGIRDVSPLASLTKLTHFGVGWNSRPLVGLSQLVASLPDLEWLKVNQLGLTDISFLEGLTKLEELNISANGTITDLKPIVCLPKLKILHVRGMHRRIGNAAEGLDVFIQYLMDNGVTVRIEHGQ